jgi:PAS domain S-box-containing protein
LAGGSANRTGGVVRLAAVAAGLPVAAGALAAAGLWSGLPVAGVSLFLGLALSLTAVLIGLSFYRQFRAERELLDFFDATSDWFWETDAEDRFTRIFGGRRPAGGADLNAVLGRRRRDMIFADLIDAEVLRRHLEAVDRYEPFEDFVYPVKGRDGIGYIRVSGRPVFRGRRFLGYRGVASDVTASQLLARALHEAEADYRSLFENLPVGIYRTTSDGRQLRANPALVALNGYASEAEQRSGVRDIAREWYVDPDRRRQFVEALDRDGRLSDFESEIYRHKTRERIWISESAVAIRDAQGRTLYYEGSVQDITARKAAEAALLASEARLREAQELALVGSWDLDHAAGRLSWSDAMCSIFEIPPGSFSGDRAVFMSFVHPDDRAKLAPPDQFYAAGENRFLDEFRLVMPDGRIKFVQSRGSAIRDSSGAVVRTIGTLQDVTESKRVALAVQRQSDHLRLTFDNMDQGLLIVDPAGLVRTWNRRLMELLELPEGVLHDGMPYRDYLRLLVDRGEHGDVDADAHLSRIIALPVVGQTVVFERQRPNGVELEIRVRALEEGSIVATYTDVTARRRIEHELRGAKEEAEAANEAKSVFLANMSHELRTPLNAIMGFAEVIRDRVLGPDADRRYREYAEHIYTSGSHLLSLISDILDMSKIDAGRHELLEERVELGHVAQECLAMVAGAASVGGVRLVNQMGHPRRVTADRRSLKQVVLNLLSNAVKFTGAGGTVIIRLRPAADGGLSIEVQDTGIGIDPAAMQTIFEPFRQAEGALNRRFGGTGLGLSISRRLMELHGGTLALSSTPGVGTVAVATLPASRLVREPAGVTGAATA